jgi:type IV secretion system protein VirD4
MVLGRSQALPGGGREAFGIVWGAAVALGVLILMGGPLVPLRGGAMVSKLPST